MRMICSVVSVWSMVKPSLYLAQLLRQWNVVVLCFLMSVTWVQTSWCVCNQFLKVKVFTSKKLTSGSLRKMVSMWWLLPTLKVKVQKMDVLSELTFWTKPFLRGLLSLSNNHMQPLQLRKSLFLVQWKSMVKLMKTLQLT